MATRVNQFATHNSGYNTRGIYTLPLNIFPYAYNSIVNTTYSYNTARFIGRVPTAFAREDAGAVEVAKLIIQQAREGKLRNNPNAQDASDDNGFLGIHLADPEVFQRWRAHAHGEGAGTAAFMAELYIRGMVGFFPGGEAVEIFEEWGKVFGEGKADLGTLLTILPFVPSIAEKATDIAGNVGKSLSVYTVGQRLTLKNLDKLRGLSPENIKRLSDAIEARDLSNLPPELKELVALAKRPPNDTPTLRVWTYVNGELQGTCFAAGTPILVPGGFKPIESISVGDQVFSRSDNHPDGPITIRVVEAVFELSAPLVELLVSGQLIRTTTEHPFFVIGRGWTPVKELSVGDPILGHNGQNAVVESLTFVGAEERVYNFRVNEDHTFFVGSPDWGFSVWVHNTYTKRARADGKWEIVDGDNVVRGTVNTPTEADSLVKEHNKHLEELLGAKLIPSIRGGEFHKWFNELSSAEFDRIWTDPSLRKQIEQRLRSPVSVHSLRTDLGGFLADRLV